MTSPSELVELRRHELAELHDQIAAARDEHAQLLSVVSLERLRREQAVARTQAELRRREARLIRIWAKLKQRWQERSRAEAERGERLRDQLAEERTRLEHRAAALDRGERRLEQRTAAFLRSARRFRAAEALADRDAGQLATLRDEIAACEARLANARARLTVPPVSRAPNPALPSDFVRPIEELADLRDRLLQQWQAILGQEAQWREEHAEAVATIVAAEESLAERDRQLREGEAQLLADQFARERELSRLAVRERRLAEREARLGALHATWARRIESVRAQWEEARTEAEAARDEWSELADVTRRIRAELVRREQAVAARELAVDKYRCETIDAAERPTAAAQRIDRRARKWLARWSADSVAVARELARLEQLALRIDERDRRADEREEDLARREAQLEQLLSETELGARIAEQSESHPAPANARPARAA